MASERGKMKKSEEATLETLGRFVCRDLKDDTGLNKGKIKIKGFIDEFKSGILDKDRFKSSASQVLKLLNKYQEDIEQEFKTKIYLENIEDVLRKHKPINDISLVEVSSLFDKGIKNYNEQFTSLNSQISELENLVGESALECIQEQYNCKFESLLKNKVYTRNALDKIHDQFLKIVHDCFSGSQRLVFPSQKLILYDNCIKCLHKSFEAFQLRNMRNIENLRKLKIATWNKAISEYERNMKIKLANSSVDEKSGQTANMEMEQKVYSIEEADRIAKIFESKLSNFAKTVAFQEEKNALKYCLMIIFEKISDAKADKNKTDAGKGINFIKSLQSSSNEKIQTLGIYYGRKSIRAGLYDLKTDIFLPVKFSDGKDYSDRIEVKREIKQPGRKALMKFGDEKYKNEAQAELLKYFDVHKELSTVKCSAESFFNKRIENALISLSITGPISLRMKLMEAGFSAGFKEVNVVSEGVAAAMAWNNQMRLVESNGRTKKLLVVLNRSHGLEFALVEINIKPFNIKVVKCGIIKRITNNFFLKIRKKIQEIANSTTLNDFLLINLCNKNSIEVQEFEKLIGFKRKLPVFDCTDVIFEGTMLLAENKLSVNEIILYRLTINERKAEPTGVVYELCQKKEVVCPNTCTVTLIPSNQEQTLDLIEHVKKCKFVLGSFKIPSIGDGDPNFSVYFGANCKVLHGEINGKYIPFQIEYSTKIQDQTKPGMDEQINVAISNDHNGGSEAVCKAYLEYKSTEARIIRQIESHTGIIKSMKDMFCSRVKKVHEQVQDYPNVTLQCIESALHELLNLEQKFPK